MRSTSFPCGVMVFSGSQPFVPFFVKTPCHQSQSLEAPTNDFRASKWLQSQIGFEKTGVLRAFTVQVWGCQKWQIFRVVVKSPGNGLHKLRVKFGLKWILPSLRFHCHSQIRWARIPWLLCRVYLLSDITGPRSNTPRKKHRTSGICLDLERDYKHHIP